MLRRARHSMVLVVYTLLALMATWPLAARFTTHVPGDGIDDPALAWNLWWIKARLVDQVNLDIFHVDWLFWPIEINLGFYTLTPLNGLLSVPLQTSLGLVPASNLILLSSYVLGAYGTFLLVLYLGKGWRKTEIHRGDAKGAEEKTEPKTEGSLDPLRSQSPIPNTPISNIQSPISNPLLPAAFLAGVIYAFASSKLFYAALGQFNIASSQWVPFTLLYVIRTGRERRWQDAALAALFLTAQAWSELTYASFLLIFIAGYTVWGLGTGDWGLGVRDRGLGTGDRGSGIGDRGSGIGDRGSGIGDRGSGIRDRGSGIGDRGSIQSPNLPISQSPITQSPNHPLPLLLLTGLLFALGIGPFLWAMLPDLLREGDFFASGGGFADIFSADLMGYLMPTQLHPLFGPWVAGMPFPNDKAQHIFIGYTAMILAGVGSWLLIRAQGWRGLFWPLMALFFFWLTLGGEVRWAGAGTGIPGPFDLISQLPFFSGNRYPSRYGVMLMLCVAVLAARGGYWVLGIGDWGLGTGKRGLGTEDWGLGTGKRQDAPRTTHHAPIPDPRSPIPNIQYLLLLLLFLFEHLSAPLPVNDFRIPAIYQRIAQEPGQFTVLELPTGWRNGARVLGRSDVLIMMQQWYQTEHGQQRLGGNTSRNPAYKFQYFTDAPLIGDLIALMNGDVTGPDGAPYMAQAIDPAWAEMVARNRAVAPQVLGDLNVRFVTLHVERSPQQLVNFVEDVLPVSLVEEWQGADWLGQPATIRLYRVDPPPPAQEWRIELGQAEANLYLAEGWPSQGIGPDLRLVNRPSAELMLPIPTQGGSLRLAALESGGGLTRVAVNGRTVWRGEPSHAVSMAIAPGLADRPLDRVRLTFGPPDPAVPLLSLAEGGWPVGETGARLRIPLFVESAGEETGGFGRIFLGGADLSPNQRGYNLVALTQEGMTLGRASFDTLAREEAAGEMAAWIRQWPPGTVIAGAVADEASLRLTGEAVATLASLGVQTDLRGRFRAGHAFVGAVGAPPASGLEAASNLAPARVHVGYPLDSLTTPGGLHWVEWGPGTGD